MLFICCVYACDCGWSSFLIIILPVSLHHPWLTHLLSVIPLFLFDVSHLSFICLSWRFYSCLSSSLVRGHFSLSSTQVPLSFYLSAIRLPSLSNTSNHPPTLMYFIPYFLIPISLIQHPSIILSSCLLPHCFIPFYSPFYCLCLI